MDQAEEAGQLRLPGFTERPITGALTGTRLVQSFKRFWTSTFQPELFSDRALEVDPLFACYKASSAQGGEVAGVVTLVNGGRSGVVAPVNARLTALKRRFGDAIREIFDVEPSGLTADEADYLNFQNADELRARQAAAERERGDRLRAKGVQPEGVRLDKSDSENGTPKGAVADFGNADRTKARQSIVRPAQLTTAAHQAKPEGAVEAPDGPAELRAPLPDAFREKANAFRKKAKQGRCCRWRRRPSVRPVSRPRQIDDMRA